MSCLADINFFSSTFLNDGLQDLRKFVLKRYCVLVHIDMDITASCNSPDSQFCSSKSKRLNCTGHFLLKHV